MSTKEKVIVILAIVVIVFIGILGIMDLYNISFFGIPKNDKSIEVDVMRDPIIEGVLMYLDGERIRLETLIESYKAADECFVDYGTGKILTSDDLAKRRAYLGLELVNVLRLMNQLVEKQIETERAR